MTMNSSITPGFSPRFPYRVEERIGEGGMGVVYRAWDPELQRNVAIKVLRADAVDGETPQVRAEARLRFLQEARAAAALSHPGITTVLRVGEDEGTPYIAMEWLAGRTLDAILREQAPLPVEQVAQLGVDLCEALDAAHAAGVIHRDIKPSNLIILPDGRVKVTDFGLARLAGSNLIKTSAGMVLATPLYASPEQLRGREVDGRSDLFSSAIVLYVALTGHRPFDGSTFGELAASVVASDPVPPRHWNPMVPPGLESVILKALSKDPALRFQRAGLLADALRPYWLAVWPVRTLTGEPQRSRDRGVFSSDSAGSDVCEQPTQKFESILKGLPSDPTEAVSRIVQSWPSKALGLQAIEALLDRLVEVPLHADAFSGVLAVDGSKLLFLHAGMIVGAIDTSRALQGDVAADDLPAHASAVLHVPPPSLGSRVVPLLASLAGERVARYADLDSTFVNLPVLARRLAGQAFSGFLFLRRNQALGVVVLDEGKPAMTFFSDGWDEVPIDLPWESWVSDLVVRACVDEAKVVPLSISYRRLFRNVELAVTPRAGTALGAGSKADTPPPFFVSKERTPTTSGLHAISEVGARSPVASLDPAAIDEFRERDGTTRLLRWMLDSLPAALTAAKKSEGWKYLAGWLPLVRRATLHHDLARPDSSATDPFDLVTFDEEGKVLHVAQRVTHATTRSFDAFVERVTVAKQARAKRGDIGGAIFVARSFDEDVAERYRAATRLEEGSASWLTEKSVTGYEGFVRMGSRRGFHLLLVVETSDGFDPILP